MHKEGRRVSDPTAFSHVRSGWSGTARGVEATPCHDMATASRQPCWSTTGCYRASTLCWRPAPGPVRPVREPPPSTVSPGDPPCCSMSSPGAPCPDARSRESMVQKPGTSMGRHLRTARFSPDNSHSQAHLKPFDTWLGPQVVKDKGPDPALSGRLFATLPFAEFLPSRPHWQEGRPSPRCRLLRWRRRPPNLSTGSPSY